jgi:hypothetical protein
MKYFMAVWRRVVFKWHAHFQGSVHSIGLSDDGPETLIDG